MTSVLVLGQPYQADRVVGALNSRATGLRATHVSSSRYLKLLAMPPRSERVVLMRVGYRVGATTRRGRVFDAYWSGLSRALPGAVRCHLWLGTDVLNTLEEARAGTLRRAAVSSSLDDLHLAVAPWLASELETVGIHAIICLLPPPTIAPAVAPPLPPDFRVLTYLPDARFDFYGGNVVLDTARRLGGVLFDVIGSEGAHGRPAPPNVRWHGWVSDMPERYAKAAVVVRIPTHDGYGNTVIEGLQNARHVVYTQDVPFVRRLSPVTAETLVAALAELRDAHASGYLGPNSAGRAYALDAFDETRLIEHLAALIRARL
jgi:hypothetical protein